MRARRAQNRNTALYLQNVILVPNSALSYIINQRVGIEEKQNRQKTIQTDFGNL